MKFKFSPIIVLSCLVFVRGSFFQRQSGDFFIGHVLSLRKSSDMLSCGMLDLTKVIQVEALVYSVKKINNEDGNLRIGYDIVDACAESKSGSQAGLNFATKTWFEDEKNSSRIPVALITNLSDERDFFSLASKVWSFAKLSPQGLPLISLQHRDGFLQITYSMTPKNSAAPRAIFELAKELEWNILNAIVDDGQFKQFQNFKEIDLIKERNEICLLHKYFVSGNNFDETSRWSRKSEREALAFVVFASGDRLPRLMSKVDGSNFSARNFLLGTEVPRGQLRWVESMRGLLGIRRDAGNLKDFERYLATSALLERAINETFCVNKSRETCSHLNDKHQLIKRLSWHGSSTIDAVYAVLNARESGSNRIPKRGLSGLRFTSPIGRVVSFGSDKNLDEVKYDVLNFRKKDSDVTAEKIGQIVVSEKIKVSVKENDIVLRDPERSQLTCSADCRPGTHRKPWDDSAGKCCWDCIPCASGTVSSFANSSRCVKCPTGSKPTKDKTKCQPPYLEYVRWHEPFSLIMFFLLAFTICFLVYTLNLYVKKAHTPVFARSKCASLPLLLSLFVTFVLPVLLLMKPTESSCSAYNVIFVFSLGIPLTFLISRSHVLRNYCYGDNGQLKRKWLRFNPQTAISWALIIFLLFFVVVYLRVAPVKVLVFNTTEPDVEYIECSSHSRPAFLPLVFLILVLAMVFNILHMNEEASPNTFNEVKFISLAVYLKYTIIFVYFVAVFGIDGKAKIRVMCGMAYLFSLNYLVTIFLPKIYLILFRPGQNLPTNPLLRDEDVNGNSARLNKTDCSDSPLMTTRYGQYDHTEV